MCSGRACRVVDVPGDGTVLVRDSGREHRVATVALARTPVVGEWLLVYAGIALQHLDDEQVRQSLALQAVNRAGTLT